MTEQIMEETSLILPIVDTLLTTVDKAKTVLNTMTPLFDNISMETAKGIRQRRVNVEKLMELYHIWKDLAEIFSKTITAEKNKIDAGIAEQVKLLTSLQQPSLLLNPKANTSLENQPRPDLRLASGMAAKSFLNAATAPSTQPVVMAPTSSKIKIMQTKMAEGVFMPAIHIDSSEQCHNFLGRWCWCAAIDRFCLSVNGFVLEAVMTTIRRRDEPVYKFIEHHTCNVDYDTVGYYVPRERNTDSFDRREFTNRMEFFPASRMQESNAYIYRLGSDDTFAADLKRADDKDRRMANDMAGLFLLVWTRACYEFKHRNVNESITKQ
jgi:hypothetical protein